MGANFTPVNVIFDTGSSWLVVQTQECTYCDLYYNYLPNLTQGYSVVPNTNSVKTYGSGTSLKGY